MREAAERELARRDRASYYTADSLRFFREVITKPEWRHHIGPVHARVAAFLEDQRFRQKLVLLPREHLKTAQITTGESLRQVLPSTPAPASKDLRVLLVHYRAKKASEYLRAIKGHLSKAAFTDKFGYLLPSPSDRLYVNTEEQLTLLSREDLSLKDPTFSTSGVDKSETSGRADLIICDDLMVDLHRNNMPLIEKTILYWQSLLDLLDKINGRMWVIGTRQHPLDLYGYIIENFCDIRCRDAEQPQDFVGHVENCNCDFDVLHMELQDEAGKFIYPERFNQQVADRLLRQKGPVDFALQYWNRAVSSELCWIPKVKLDAALCDPEEILKLKSENALIWINTVDPAESKKKRSAYTGNVMTGIHKTTGLWYVDLAVQRRVAPEEFPDFIFEWHRVYRPYRFGLETNTRKAMKTLLEQKMMIENYYFTLDELAPGYDQAEDKQRRFRQVIVPLFNYGRIRINRLLRDLIAALGTVPQCRTWDLLDCLAYVIDLAPVIAIPNDPSAAKIQLPERVIGWPGTGY